MPIYSHSRLSCFETCPRQYWYHYVAKVEVPELQTIEAFLGTRVHDALEQLYQNVMGGHQMTAAELLACYESKWQASWSDEVKIVRADRSADDYRRVGRDALTAYHARNQPFNQSRTLRLEARVLLGLDSSGKYRLQGYIDRLARRADGTYEIHDYKTSAHLPTQAEADADRQLALYQLGVQQMWNDVEAVDLIWHYVRFDQDIRSRRSAEQLDAVKAECISVIDDVESRGREEGSFPTQPSNLCSWCSYQEICPATRHAVAVKALPPKTFKADDGVKLVDQWAEIKKKQAALAEQDEVLGAEEEQIKQVLLAFAQQQGLEAVAGTAYHAAIREKTALDYPRSGDERREKLEAALERLKLLDQVVTINTQKLKSLLNSLDELPVSARKVLKPFVTETKTTEIKLRPGGAGEE
jgi:putative RecB family exonuclease